MDLLRKNFAIVGAVGVVSSVLMAATLAKVVQPTVKAQVVHTLPGGVSVVPKPIRVIEITKQDRLPVPAAPVAPVKVASVEPEAPVVAEPEPQVHRVRRPRYTESGDICARHHLRKVVIGRGWRCR